MINVLALYADRSGCGDYRVRFPADAVNAREEELGVHVEVSDHLDADATRTTNGFRIRSVEIPGGIDVVSFQRPLKAEFAGAIAWIRQRRPDVGIVVELDDDLTQVPMSNAAYHATHPAHNPSENYKWMRQAVAHADVLTVSTSPLAMVFGHSIQTFVINNAVPASMLQLPSRALARGRRNAEPDRVIGWAGYAGTHGGDLEVTSGALADIIGSDLLDGGRVAFRQIGPPDGVAEALGLPKDAVRATGWLSPTSLYRAALGELDIGIVPLADTRFNRAKSALKVLEFAAAGVPTVASKTPEHTALQDSGAPVWLVGDRRRHWVGALRNLLLLSDADLAGTALSAREFVRRNHTTYHRAPQWAHAWRTAVKIARSR